MNSTTQKTILTGIKPTGRPHLGNYLGMIKPAIDMMNGNKGSTNVLFIANYHALNSMHDRTGLRDSTYDVAATLLACGLDTANTLLYRQSDIPEIFELATILTSVTPKMMMNRSHAYKALTQSVAIEISEAHEDFTEKHKDSKTKIVPVFSPYGSMKRLLAVPKATFDQKIKELPRLPIEDYNTKIIEIAEEIKIDCEGFDDVDEDISMGLYTYPILMAADILIADTTHVPVGKDQMQHVEFARDIAGYFNNTFGKTLTLPEHVIKADVATVPGLDGRKMSKSYGNVVPIFDTPKNIEAAVKRIVTDSARPEDVKDPETNNIYLIYKSIAAPADAAAMADAFRKGGMGYGDAKKLLLDCILAEFQPKFALYEKYLNDRAAIDRILADGAARVRPKAQEVMARVRKAVGA